MRIEKWRNRIYHLTLSGYELAALISSARWVADGAKGELTSDALKHLKQVLASYDKAARKMNDEKSDKESKLVFGGENGNGRMKKDSE